MAPVLLVLAFLGCTPGPTPQELGQLVLKGEIDAAAERLEEEPEEGELPRWKTLLERIQALEPEREAVGRAEAEMLAVAIEEAIAEGRFEDVTEPLRAGLLAHPDDPRFPALQKRLRALAEEAPPETAAFAWGALAATFEADPERRVEMLQRQHEAALLARYQPESLERTRAAQRGIRLEGAIHLLRRLDREYHVTPSWRGAMLAAQQRLDWLQHAEGAKAAWPRLAGIAWPEPPQRASVETAIAALEGAIRTGESAGVPAEVIIDEWVGGALASLDPWTRAVWPAEMSAWEAHHAGVSYGVGLELDEGHDGSVRVARPLPGGPAWESGIHQDDLLVRIRDDRGAIDLVSVPPERRLALAEDALAGEPGTAVSLTVSRDEKTVLDFELIRAPVPVETVLGFSRNPDNSWNPWLSEEDGLAYARITAFREHSEPAFDALLEPVLDRVRGLVLDLRGNPGGDVNAAVQIADRFVSDGVLAELSGRVKPETGPLVDPETGNALAPWNHAIPGHGLEGVPIVVLVDRETASAAEILAGSLQERADAVVIGAPTWGKGLAQALRAEPELGYGVQFTNQVWTLPSGRRLSREVEGGGGIQPALLLDPGPGERFQVTLLSRERTALRVHADGTPMRPTGTKRRDDLPLLSGDPALVLAELALRARLAEQATD